MTDTELRSAAPEDRQILRALQQAQETVLAFRKTSQGIPSSEEGLVQLRYDMAASLIMAGVTLLEKGKMP